MNERKIITPAQAPGLIVGGRESHLVTITIVVEGSCAEVLGKPSVERFRDDSGRWIKAETWKRRLEAMGATVANGTIGPRGPHTPSY